jgi:hypothetical protein
MTKSIAELTRLAAEQVDAGASYMTAYINDQMTAFEVAILDRFTEATIAATIQNLEYFISEPSLYFPSDDTFQLQAHIPDMWDVIAENSPHEGRMPLDCIIRTCDDRWIDSQPEFERCLQQTAAFFVATSVLDGIERYRAEKTDAAFADLASGDDDD